MDATSFPSAQPEIDITIIGHDTIAMVFAYACLCEGLSVQVVQSQANRAFPSITWVREELAQLNVPIEFRSALEESILYTWEQVEISIHRQNQFTVNTAYTLSDQSHLYQWLREKVVASGAKLYIDDIDEITHVDNHSVAIGAQTYASRFVVVTDRTDLLLKPAHPEPVFKFVYEEVVELEESTPHITSSPHIMNFQVPTRFRRHYQSTPSFLSSFPLSNRTMVLQETVLSSRSGVGKGFLKQRLDLRKASMRTEQTKGPLLEQHFTQIPLGGELPEFGRTLALGAAAGCTEPFVGIQYIRSIHEAFSTARHLRSHWRQTPDQLTKAVWNQIWSVQQQQQRKLHLLELDMLSRFNLRETQSYLDVLFKDSKSLTPWTKDAMYSGILLSKRSHPEEIQHGSKEHKVRQSIFTRLPIPLHTS